MVNMGNIHFTYFTFRNTIFVIKQNQIKSTEMGVYML